MTTPLKWLVLGGIAIGILAMVLLGPGRTYGLLRARQFEGRVAKIRPLDMEEEAIPEAHLVELNSSQGEVCVFASSDRKWVMVEADEWVRVRLYPAPPWSSRLGQWQNASLLTKIVPPPPEEETEEESKETAAAESEASAKPAAQTPAKTPPQPAQPETTPQQEPTPEQTPPEQTPAENAQPEHPTGQESAPAEESPHEAPAQPSPPEATESGPTQSDQEKP